jgi:transcriptional regulator with XRE-family HTH domain
MSPTPKQMGRRIQKLREDRDMSRAQLAQAAGISRQYVRSLELGEYDPTLGTLQKIAKAFGVKLTELVG